MVLKQNSGNNAACHVDEDDKDHNDDDSDYSQLPVLECHAED